MAEVRESDRKKRRRTDRKRGFQMWVLQTEERSVDLEMEKVDAG